MAAERDADLFASLLQAILSRAHPGAQRLTVLTGAGISTESGVPDFRSPDSPWRIHAPIGFKDFVRDPTLRAEALRRKFAMDDLYQGVKPGRSHLAIAALATCGVLHRVLTQNIDGLHQAAGLDPSLLLELHGNGTFAHCLSCGQRSELIDVRRHLESTGEAPICACGGLIKSATIAFGQPLAPGVAAAAVEASKQAQVFLAIGSSLVVRPAAHLPLVAKEAGAMLVIVNREPTPLDAAADYVLAADAGDFLVRLATLAEEQHVRSFSTATLSAGDY